MQLWNEILRLSIIGLSNTGLPSNCKKALNDIGLVDFDDKLLLLEGMATISLMNKLKINADSFHFDKATLAPKEDKYHQSNPGIIPIIKRILHLGELDILAEYFFLCKKHDIPVIPDFWPQFLNRSITDPDFFDLLKPILNKRARWLIQINTNWQPLLMEPESEADLGFHISVQTYRRLRIQDYPLSTKYIFDYWNQFIIPEKRQILKIIDDELRTDDLALLEKLNNLSEVVIQPMISKIILKFPDSELSMKSVRLIENYTYYHLGFEVIEDEDIFNDFNWVKGMEAVITTNDPLISIYFNVIAHLHPAALQKHFELSLESFFLRARLSSKKKLWMAALINAALIHKEQKWLQAIIKLKYEYPDLIELSEDQFSEICSSISIEYFKKKTSEMLGSDMLLPANKPFLNLILYADHFWPKNVTLKFFEKLCQWMIEAESGKQKMWRFEKYLKRAALKSDPSLEKQIRQMVLPILQNSYRYAAAFEQFFLIMEIRLHLRKEFEKEITK